MFLNMNVSGVGEDDYTMCRSWIVHPHLLSPSALCNTHLTPFPAGKCRNNPPIHLQTMLVLLKEYTILYNSSWVLQTKGFVITKPDPVIHRTAVVISHFNLVSEASSNNLKQ
jgi:hypothetical protein